MTADNKLEYKDHIRHYRKDADFHNYFKNDPIEEHNIKRRYAQIFNWLKSHAERLILEIGSGGGYAVEQIEETSNSYVPMDIPLNNLKGIKSWASGEIYPVSGDVYNLPFQNNSIYTIILSEVLEHLQDPQVALKEMCRVLSDEGLLVISVPYKEKITYQICVHCNQPTPTHAHFHSFDEQSIEAFIKHTNLRIERKVKLTNRLLSRISTIFKLNYLPFTVWKILDRLSNILVPKPSHIIFQLRKPTAISK